ncbi:MAG: GTPase [Planctomycetaceae bacterium]|nr:GTPase [Planctomycetaceae bacterium]
MAAEIVQLELLAQIDDVVRRLQSVADRPSAWEPLQHAHSVLQRLLQRVDPLRLRVDAPLVVATFGGTGVGKSSLVNALVGEDVATVGRQRPTTIAPTLLAHPETDLTAYPLPWDELTVVRRDVPLLRDLLLLDCPDPDTSETEEAGTNLARLHRILPACDVLLYVSSQQKYRSAKVSEELAHAAETCKLIFVQTHADQDADIREDWRRQLAPAYQIAEMFFVDSRKAIAEQQAGMRPSGEIGRLLDLLFRELSAAQRVRIRRGNLFGVVQATLDRINTELAEHAPSVKQLETVLQSQRQALTTRLTTRLQDELLVSRGLWERRVMGQIAQLWGFSPFALVLRAYYSQASLLASWTLMRAQSSAQLALWGAVHGTRWLASRRQESGGEDQVERLAALQLSDAELREAQIVIEGYTRAARLDRAAADLKLSTVKHSAAQAEDEFWAFARQRLDVAILQTARQRSGLLARIGYEVVFAILPVYLLVRIGKNFFWDSWFYEKPLLESHFYIPAALFLGLWTLLILACFTWRLRSGLKRSVQQLAEELAQSKLAAGLFPQLDEHCRDFTRDTDELRRLASQVAAVREQVHEAPGLSGLRPLARPA